MRWRLGAGRFEVSTVDHATIPIGHPRYGKSIYERTSKGNNIIPRIGQFVPGDNNRIVFPQVLGKFVRVQARGSFRMRGDEKGGCASESIITDDLVPD